VPCVDFNCFGKSISIRMFELFGVTINTGNIVVGEGCSLWAPTLATTMIRFN